MVPKHAVMVRQMQHLVVRYPRYDYGRIGALLKRQGLAILSPGIFFRVLPNDP